MYADGRGVLKDDAEAVRWYRLAADQGLAAVQFTLGAAYTNGAGLSSRTMPKPEYGSLAAEDQGHAEAQGVLGACKALTAGRPQGFRARAHVVEHSALGTAMIRKKTKRPGNLETLEDDMTRAEISRATELARACMASDYQACEP